MPLSYTQETKCKSFDLFRIILFLCHLDDFDRTPRQYIQIRSTPAGQQLPTKFKKLQLSIFLSIKMTLKKLEWGDAYFAPPPP